MVQIKEKQRNIPVVGEYDVSVVGGGVAGIAAALAAARNGAKTILIEREFALGGLATLGLVTIYLPLCDGCGRQVSFGIAEELLRLSVSRGYECGKDVLNAWCGEETQENIQKRKDLRYQVRFNAQAFALLSERALLDAGVEILYGTLLADVQTEDKKVTALLLENKSGRIAVKVKSVVDATGDADVFARAGAATRNFAQGNVLAAWYYRAEQGKMRLRSLGFADIPEREKKETKAPPLLDERRFSGLDGKELSQMTILSHEHVWKDFLKEGDITDDYSLCTMCTIPQVRMTRSLVGVYMLAEEDEGKRFEDSVGMVSNWKRRGPVFEVPFSSLYGADLKNVIAAGRCVSNTDEMWDIMRVIPCCAVTGQAAGTAAALCDEFSCLPIENLQTTLQAQGVKLHLCDLDNN